MKASILVSIYTHELCSGKEGFNAFLCNTSQIVAYYISILFNSLQRKSTFNDLEKDTF